jgi:hypothetical protein
MNLMHNGRFAAAVVGFTATALLGVAARKEVWDFSDSDVGKLPAGFKSEVGSWVVAEDGGNKVLAQTEKNPDSVFNLVFVANTNQKDVDLSVRLKAVAGSDDQGGGLVWRGRDKNNYYLARYNPLEDNYRLYKVEKGKRTMFKNADIKATPGWHTLRVTMKGDKIECYYDGRKYLEVMDTTFPDAGMIGLWSKADAQSYFDDLTLTDV